MSEEKNEVLEELRAVLPHSPVFEIEFTDDNVSYLNSKIGGSYFWPDDETPNLQFSKLESRSQVKWNLSKRLSALQSAYLPTSEAHTKATSSRANRKSMRNSSFSNTAIPLYIIATTNMSTQKS